MKNLENLSNHEIVREYKKLNKKISKLTNFFCENNLGHLTPSNMRDLCNKSKEVLLFLDYLDQSHDLKNEAKRRYGPSLIFIEELVYKK